MFIRNVKTSMGEKFSRGRNGRKRVVVSKDVVVENEVWLRKEEISVKECRGIKVWRDEFNLTYKLANFHNI